MGDTLRDLCELSSSLYPQEWGSQCLGLQAWPPPGPILNNLRKTYHSRLKTSQIPVTLARESESQLG